MESKNEIDNNNCFAFSAKLLLTIEKLNKLHAAEFVDSAHDPVHHDSPRMDDDNFYGQKGSTSRGVWTSTGIQKSQKKGPPL